MSWKRLGRIFCATGERSWMVSHGANPLAVPGESEVQRILFNCRDNQGRSHVGWLDIRLDDPRRILALADQPLLSPGGRGEFDDAGVSVGNLVPHGDGWRLYYLGWTLGVSVPFRNTIGLAHGNLVEGFVRHGRIPVLDRNEQDPLSLSYPWVLKDGDGWAMWYGSTTAWGEGADMTHVLHRADSADGIRWQPHGNLLVLPLSKGENAHSRPCLLREKGRWLMWFSCKTEEGYRIGHAQSDDGLVWQRQDEKGGLPPSGEGWDSDEVCYPSIFESGGRRYLLYCGNGYGRTGFGLAVWETE